MSRIQSVIVSCCDDVVEVPDAPNDNLTFISLTKLETFKKYQNATSQSTGYLIGDTHGQNLSRIAAHAYKMKIQYLKVMYGAGQVVYLRKDKPLIRLNDGSWGVEMNVLRRAIKARIKEFGKSTEEEDQVFFDDRYKGFGVIHDMAFLLGSKAVNVPDMDLDDLTVYIARWGGIPGKERFIVPYNL